MTWPENTNEKKQVQRNKQILFKIKMLWYLTFYQSESHSVMPNSLWPHRLYSRWNSPDQNTGVGGLSLLQGIFPTQGLNPGHPYCRQNLYQLSHQGSPRILEWAVHPFQQIFPTQESKQGLLYCRQILYQRSYQGSPIQIRSSPKGPRTCWNISKQTSRASLNDFSSAL